MSNDPNWGPADWGRASSPDPYVRWGDTIRLDLTSGALVTAEFQRIELPRPALCRVALHATIRPAPLAVAPGLLFTSFIFTVGNGASHATVRRRWNKLPQIATASQPNGTPLDVDWYVPLQYLYGRIEAQAIESHGEFTLWLSPVYFEAL